MSNQGSIISTAAAEAAIDFASRRNGTAETAQTGRFCRPFVATT